MQQKPTAQILMAEPTASFRWLYQATFLPEGIHLKMAAKANEFLQEITQKRDYDLLVLDPALFGAHSLRVLKFIASHYSLDKVVLLSNRLHPEWAETSMQMGVAEYLLKGNFTPQTLVSRFEEILAWAENQSEDPKVYSSEQCQYLQFGEVSLVA